MKMALTALLKKVTDQKSDLWNADKYGSGDTFSGFTTTYDIDIKKLDAEIDAFCATFEKGNPK